MRVFNLQKIILCVKRNAFLFVLVSLGVYLWSVLSELVSPSSSAKVSNLGDKWRSREGFPILSSVASELDSLDLGNTTKRHLYPRNTSFCPRREIIESQDVIMAGESSSQQKKLFSFGIPSVVRQDNLYLENTLKSLIDNMSPSDMKEAVVVVFLADFDQEKKNALVRKLKETFGQYFDSGLLRVVQAPHSFYPPLGNLKRRFGDSEQRVYWRAKQAIDFAFLFCYCKHLSEYYVHLEDDIIAAPLFLPRLKEFIKEEKKKWFTLDASWLGYIGKVYHSSDLDQIASFIMLFYDEMPADWLQNIWRDLKGQTYVWRLRPYALFQHIGHQSTLADKIQDLSEKYFDKNTQKYLGLNPPGLVTTDLETHKGTPQQAYSKGSGYFWAKGPVKFGSHLTVKFHSAVKVHRLEIDTGSNVASNDFIHQGIVQVAENEKNNCGEFKYIGDFVNGTYEENTDFPYKVKCVNIQITKDQPQWLFIWGINIWPDD